MEALNMYKKIYQKKMDKMYLRDEKKEEIRQAMYNKLEVKSRQRKGIPGRRLKYVAAAILIGICIPVTGYAVAGDGTVLQSFFYKTEKEPEEIRKNTYSLEETIEAGKYRYTVEEYLYDSDMGMGYLVYSAEKKNGEKLDRDKEYVPTADIELEYEGKEGYASIESVGVGTTTATERKDKVYFKTMFRVLSKKKLSGGQLYLNFKLISSKADSIRFPINQEQNICHYVWKGKDKQNKVSSIKIAPFGILVEGKAGMLEKVKKFSSIELELKNGEKGTLWDLGIAKIEDTETISKENGEIEMSLSFEKLIDISDIERIFIDGVEHKGKIEK